MFCTLGGLLCSLTADQQANEQVSGPQPHDMLAQLRRAPTFSMAGSTAGTGCQPMVTVGQTKTGQTKPTMACQNISSLMLATYPSAVAPMTSSVRQPNRRHISTVSPDSAFCPSTFASRCALACMMAVYDRKLQNDVGNAFVRALFASHVPARSCTLQAPDMSSKMHALLTICRMCMRWVRGCTCLC